MERDLTKLTGPEHVEKKAIYSISRASITDKHSFIVNEVLTTPEAIELLNISRARLSVLIKKGRVIPIKKLGCTSIFLKDDLLEAKKELDVLRKQYRPYEYR